MPVDTIKTKLAELGFRTDDLDQAVIAALNELQSFRKPLFDLNPKEALRQAIIRLTARAGVLGDDALLLGYLFGAAIKGAGQ